MENGIINVEICDDTVTIGGENTSGATYYRGQSARDNDIDFLVDSFRDYVENYL